MSQTDGYKRRLSRVIRAEMPAIMDKYDITSSQCEDLIARMVESNVIHIDQHDDFTASSWDVADYVDSVRDRPDHAHIFAPKTAPAPKDSDLVCGMPKDEFNRLPAQRRLELANAEAAKNAKARRSAP